MVENRLATAVTLGLCYLMLCACSAQDVVLNGQVSSAPTPSHVCASGPSDSAMTSDVATIGGGCFWCLDACYRQMRGVLKICTGTTGHAEVVQITYDPSVVSYMELLEVFFTIHDPTTKDRLTGPLVTELSPIPTYYPAEKYHQDYYNQNPNQGYCMMVVAPKISKLRSKFMSKLISFSFSWPTLVMGLSAGKLYLFAYNAFQSAGWAFCLHQIISTYLASSDFQTVNDVAGQTTGLFQAISLLEVVHAATGLVPSSPVSAFTQWIGRSHALFCILLSVSSVQSTVFGPLMLFVWAVAEVVRYPWYALTCIGQCPTWLTWLRYTAFIPLYPVGVVCEMALLVLALPTLEADGRWSLRMPNNMNWGFEYSVFIKVVLAIYPFMWWNLYSTLLTQRKKRLGAPVEKKTA
eukprot:gene20085-26802_t